MSHPFTPLGNVYDDFRALPLGTDLSGRVSQSGHTWVVYQNTWTVQDPGSGEGYAAAGSGSGTFARCGIDFGISDVELEVTVHVSPPDNSGGIMFRRTASGYYVYRDAVHTGTDLIKVTNAGTITSLGEAATDPDELSVMKMICSGSSIDCYLDGVLQISATDSTYNGTVHGLYQGFGSISDVSFYAFNMHPLLRPSGIVVGAIV